MTITAILTILFAHFFSDFVIQPEKYAINKWHSNKALSAHIGLYTLGIFLFAWMWFPGDWSFLPYYAGWAIVNGCFHFMTDYVTARDMNTYRQEKDMRMFYVTLGIDQMAHYTALFVTYSILTNIFI